MIAQLQYEGDMLKSANFKKGFQERPLWTKLQTLTPAEMVLWIDRFDSLSAISCEWSLVQAFEKSNGMEIPKRTQYVRSILCEVNRLIWLTTYLGRIMKALGGVTLHQEVMVLREQALAAQEELTGGRILPQALSIGGCRRELALGHIQKVRQFILDWRSHWNTWAGLVLGDVLLEKRLTGLIPISKTLVKRLGWWGIVGKASGLNYDSRKHRPHGAYPFAEFTLVERQDGDAKARFDVVIDEVNLTLDLLNQFLSEIPNDPGERPTASAFTPGFFYGASESAKGPIISCVEVTGQKQVGTVRLFSSSQRVWPVIDHLFSHLRAEDFQLAFASLGIDSEDGEV